MKLVVDSDNNTIEYSYYDNNKIKSIEERTELFKEFVYYEYEEKDNILIEKQIIDYLDNTNRDTGEKTIYIKHLNKNGNILFEQTNNNTPNIYEYDENTKKLIYSKINDMERFYNDKDLIIKKINSRIEINYTYDFNNNLIEKNDSNGVCIKYENEYLIQELDIINFFNFDNKTLDISNV